MSDTAVIDTGDTACVPTREIQYDGIDQDCDGSDLVDVDGDGYDATRVGGDDCNDANAAIHPGVAETCGNLADDDCNGVTDEDCAATGAPDPGGIAWICGVSPPGESAHALLLAAVLIFFGRRR